MAEIEITLADGLTTTPTDGGEETTHVQCTIGELNAGDILDSEMESERVHVVTIDGKPQPYVVASPALMNANMLRRQVKSIGSIRGPLSLTLFKKLSTADLDDIRENADQLAGAGAAGLSDGGRVAPGAASD